MAARRCSVCDINYPPDLEFGTCKVCGKTTRWDPKLQPSADWDLLAADKIVLTELETPDPVTDWRYEQLVAAGYPKGTALQLATRRDIDLHQACDLATKAGPRLALRIIE